VAELEWALEHDVRIIITGVGPVVTAAGGNSPSHEKYDPFWSRVNEAGITVALHGGDSAYSRYIEAWGESAEMEAFRASPLRGLLSHDPMHDTVAAMLASQFFHRFPNIRVASIELGSTWAVHLFEKLAKVFGQAPAAFPEDPRDTFRRHVWVSPYYEDDLAALKDLIGVERILMGSDWPHAEGLADPTDYIEDLRRFGYTDDEARLVMHDNGWSLAKNASLSKAGASR
jgi:predicted TIM-barrel fold metal-dependent hydrolase